MDNGICFFIHKRWNPNIIGWQKEFNRQNGTCTYRPLRIIGLGLKVMNDIEFKASPPIIIYVLMICFQLVYLSRLEKLFKIYESLEDMYPGGSSIEVTSLSSNAAEKDLYDFFNFFDACDWKSSSEQTLLEWRGRERRWSDLMLGFIWV